MDARLEARDERRAGRNRAATLSEDASLPGAGSEREDLIQGDDDGLAGYVVRLAPGAQEILEVPSSSAGQYHLVTRGTILHGDRELERMALLFIHPSEQVTLAAGPVGAEVLVMQFPGKIEPGAPS